MIEIRLDLITIVVWVTIWGTLGALIAPRKGRPPSWGFAIGAFLAVFGVAYIALQPDMTPEERDVEDRILRKRFRARSREAALAAFESDRPLARRAGWEPFAERWTQDVGEYVLEVSYREDDDS